MRMRIHAHPSMLSEWDTDSIRSSQLQMIKVRYEFVCVISNLRIIGIYLTINY